MEYVREVRITIYIDTNKGTYQRDFKDIDEAVEYLNNTLESIRGY